MKTILQNIINAERGHVVSAVSNCGHHNILFRASDGTEHQIELVDGAIYPTAYENGEKLLLGIADVLEGKLAKYRVER